MAKVKNKKVDEETEKEMRSMLLKEIKKIESFDRLDDFFNKYMTSDEKILFFRRFAVISLLGRGTKYRDIENLLDISSATISSVQDAISGRGYRRHLNRKKEYKIFIKANKSAKQHGLRYKGTSGLLDPFA